MGKCIACGYVTEGNDPYCQFCAARRKAEQGVQGERHRDTAPKHNRIAIFLVLSTLVIGCFVLNAVFPRGIQGISPDVPLNASATFISSQGAIDLLQHPRASQIVGRIIQPGAKITVLEELRDWVRIEFNGIRGWATKKGVVKSE